jgi:hypothetical protein
MLQWFQDCTQNHPECSASNSDFWLPTRLIDLGLPTCQMNPKIIETHSHAALNGQDRGIKYATLSHCWGHVQPLRLLTSNIERLKNGIPLRSVPKTFSDAVRVTKSLGLRYLWIDSLCILQDSHEDWLRESVSMGDVYGRSHCGIAATGAFDGSQGLFLPHSPTTDTTITFTCHWDGMPELQCVVIDPLNVWRKGFEKLPLNRRGWVMQERILAPRVLHFTSNEIFWECRRHAASGKYPMKLPDLLQQYHDTRNQLLRCDQEEFYGVWMDVIKSYSRAQLTFTKDKLIAISGLVSKRQVMHQSSDRNIAGMWEHHLPSSLVWIREDMFDGEYLPRRLNNLYIPSWSWASLNCPIDASWTKSYGSDGRCLATIEDMVETSAKRWTLSIRAPIAQVTWKEKGAWDERGKQGHGYYIATVGSISSSQPSPNPNLPNLPDNTFNVIIFDALEEDEPPQTLWSVAIREDDAEMVLGGTSSKYRAVYGLIMNRENDTLFQRLGTFRVGFPEAEALTKSNCQTISLI